MCFSKLFKKWKKNRESRTLPSEMPERNLTVSFASDAGKIRTENEDNFFIDGFGGRTQRNCSGKVSVSDSQIRIFAVFDGMGGEAYGKEAAEIAVESLKTSLSDFSEAKEKILKETVQTYVKKANAEICRMIAEKHCKRSGCTMVLVCILNGKAYTFSVGDSRIYYYHQKLQQISEDQTLAMKKLKANIYTEEEARNSDDAHKITSYLGIDTRNVGVPMLSYPPFELADGKILICSDGLTDMCSDDKICSILNENSENEAQALVNQALKNGGEDNVTCIVLQYAGI